jgi:hypothetical protein
MPACSKVEAAPGAACRLKGKQHLAAEGLREGGRGGGQKGGGRRGAGREEGVRPVGSNLKVHMCLPAQRLGRRLGLLAQTQTTPRSGRPAGGTEEGGGGQGNGVRYQCGSTAGMGCVGKLELLVCVFDNTACASNNRLSAHSCSHPHTPHTPFP